MSGSAMTVDLMVHVHPGATSRATIHANEDRVVLELRGAQYAGGLMLFLDRTALVNLHALTGSALTELGDRQAADAAPTKTADTSAA